MRSKILLSLSLALMLAACDDYPRDIENTMQGVEQSGRLRAGLISAGDNSDTAERELVNRIAEAAGAEASFEEGSAETLFRRLEQGELDIVVGHIAKASPWKKRVALTKSAEAKSPPKKLPVLRAALRKGENRWLLFISRHLKAGA